MSRRDVVVISWLTATVLCACSGGGGAAADAAGGDFVAEKTDPVNGAILFLNDAVSVDFSAPVDLDSASLTTMSFQVFDQNGSALQELVTGNFNLATRPGDAEPGRRLQFVPSFPTNNTFSDGGFRAGRGYLVSLVGGNSPSTVLRSSTGKQLALPLTFRFSTRDGTQPAQLFRNPQTGGPARVGLEVTTATDLQNVPLALFGAPPLEVRLHFDQALNPADTNVPVNLDTDPLVRDESLKGRVFLEYHDPEYDPLPDDYTWIPADVEIERNDLTGATLALRPVGVLPNNATIRVIVEATLEDIAGESNLADPTFNRVFGVLRTQSAFEQQWNGIVESFDTIGNVDLAAAFPETTAEVGPGYLKAGFAFEGNETTRDYEPNTAEVVLNTAFTQIAPTTGLPFTVTGGVFNFRDVTIPQGVLVRGTGPNPMVWLCNGKFTVAGTLTVRGGDGARVDTLNSANFAKAGGVAGPAGGNGGDGTPSATARDQFGGSGRGPLQAAGKGGRGGLISCSSACFSGNNGGGSGGGGGSMATQGDPHYRGTTPPALGTSGNNANNAAANAFQQKLGFGGTGCSGGSGTRTAYREGGLPGEKTLADTRRDNDFWGSGIRLDGTPLRITGELAVPAGGGGGGGGGDRSPTQDCSTSGSTPAGDNSGGGGGGGGGVLIVKALEEITILSTGKIIADGGNGGGGEQAGSCNQGGGGGGAGGLVVLMSAKAIRIEAHGSTATNRFVYGPSLPAAPGLFAGDDYDFAISADGGICRTGTFGGGLGNAGKYPANGATMIAGEQYDANPLGGLGGMGIVQLMVPPGPTDPPDGTNTVLDDNIHFYPPGALSAAGTPVPVQPANKQQLLAWRGFPNANGVFVDDAGQPTNIGSNEGDIRPAPVLLPVPFSTRSRAQSKWIDTGASQRRGLTAPDDGARGIVLAGGAEVGPKFEFSWGFDDLSGHPPGYAKYIKLGTSGVKVEYEAAVSSQVVSSVATGAEYLGAPAYRVTLATPALGQANRYVQHEAELQNASGAALGSFRILSHSDSELLLDAGTDVLPANVAKTRILRKFFKVVTNNSEGLGPVRVVGATTPGTGIPVPIANLRIGFAFHWDPFVPGSEATNRFPADGFTYDLNELQAFVEDPANNAITAGRQPRYVKWDVLFDLAYDPPAVPGEARALSPNTPRPELHFLRLPFRW